MNPVDPRAAELIQRHLDGTCTPQETRELSALLKGRPDLAAELFESARIDGWISEALPRADDCKVPLKRRPRHGIPFWIGSIAAALVAGFFTVDALKRHPIPATGKSAPRTEKRKSPEQGIGKGQAAASADDLAAKAESLRRSEGGDGIFDRKTADKARLRALAEAEEATSGKAWLAGAPPPMKDTDGKRADLPPTARGNYPGRVIGAAQEGQALSAGATDPSTSVPSDASDEVLRVGVVKLDSDRMAEARETRAVEAARMFLQTHQSWPARNSSVQNERPRESSDGNRSGLGAPPTAGDLAAVEWDDDGGSGAGFGGRGAFGGKAKLHDAESDSVSSRAADVAQEQLFKKEARQPVEPKPGARALPEAGLRLLNSRTDSDGTWTGRFASGQDESVLLEVRIAIGTEAEVRIITPESAE